MKLMRSAAILKNLKDYLRTDNDHLDVTLACEGNQQIRAHKVILSAGSLFFREVLANAKHPEPFIFLGGGVRMTDLKSLVEYIYLGETNVAANNLEEFVKTARLLQVTGMNDIDNQVLDEYTGDADDMLNKLEEADEITEQIEKQIVYNCMDSNNRIDKIIESVNTEHVKREDVRTDSDDEMYKSIETTIVNIDIDLPTDDGEVKEEKATFKPENLRSEAENKINDSKFNELIQKVDGLWECVKCGKTGLEKSAIKRHAETHLEYSIHNCTHCSKILRTRDALRNHISYYHSDQSFVCSICGKSGMTKGRLRGHMRRGHGNCRKCVSSDGCNCRVLDVGESFV